MSLCPYTWVRDLFKKKEENGLASYLRVTVSKGEKVVVDVSLPAKSAGWLIELIPEDVLSKIRSEGIPIEEIQKDLSQMNQYFPQKIFLLSESHRTVNVWLE